MPLTRSTRLGLEAAFVGALALGALVSDLGVAVAAVAAATGVVVAALAERRLRRFERPVPRDVALLQAGAAAAYVAALGAGLAYVAGDGTVLLAFLWLAAASLGALLMTAAVWRYRENRPR